MGDVIEILTTATNTVEVESQGPQGIPGVGVPTGGSALQVLRKKTSTDYDTEWAAAGSGSGSVTSVTLASTDLTISGSPITDSGTITANIAANAVTLEKLQTISSEHLLGRHGNGNGGVQQIGLGTGLAMSGSNVRVATTGITAGTYTKLTIDETGRATVGATAAPSDIGAQSSFVSGSGIIGATTLTAGRAVNHDVSNFGSSPYSILLPVTGSLEGDIRVFRSTNAIGAEVRIQTPFIPSPFTVGTLTATGQQIRFIYRAGIQEWQLVPVDSHPANRISSGTLTHERGGLAADVSAYNGLVKISGGSTSAVGIGAGSAEVAAGDHGHGNLTSDGKIGSTSGLPVVTTTAGAVTTLALGTANQVLRVNSGASGVEFADPAAAGVTGAASSASDVLGVSGSNITGVDANADRLIFFDDSAGKLTHLTVGSGLSISDTTLTATATGTIGGSTGATDNSVLRSDGAGGSTAQSSAITISDEIRTFSITGDAAADTITTTGSSGFANGQRVRITALTGGSGLSTGNYFVINASGDTFQVSTTEGGAASLFTTNITAGTILNGHFAQQHTQISNTGANTDIPLVLTPKGTGAFIVGLPPDGTTTGGNSRGAYAIDISTGAPRVAADRVGSGINSVSIGRQAFAQSESSIAVGYGAACSSAAYSVAIGLNAATAANDAIGIGQYGTARSANSIAIGNTALVDSNFSNAIAIGASSAGGATSAIAIGASTSVTGVNAVGLNTGTSLRSAFACRPFQAVYWGGQTTNNAATILNLDATATNRFTIAASTALAVDILLVARRTDVADKWLVARRFLGIRRDGSNNTSLIGAVQTLGTDQSTGSPTWTFALTADDTNEALQLEVTGATGETINWRATAIYRSVG